MRATNCPKCRQKRDFKEIVRNSGGYQYYYEECTKCFHTMNARKKLLTPQDEDILNTKYFKEEKIRKQIRRGLW